MSEIIKTFTFVDESGMLNPVGNRSYYGLGSLKHPKPNELIQKLHKVYEGLCGELKKEETSLEFSFKSTTAKSIKYDLRFLDVLTDDPNWEFNCLYFDPNDKYYISPRDAVKRWDCYVTYIKMLLRNNFWINEQTAILADYQRKPKGSNKRLEFVSSDLPQVYGILQTESHGVLLIQAVDVLLGGFLYSLSSGTGDKEGNKTRIASKVVQIKNRIGKDRFNCWPLDWSKGSSIGRV